MEQKPVTCVECRCEWLDERERWLAFMTVDDDPVFYCPRCAFKEFDPAADDDD